MQGFSNRQQYPPASNQQKNSKIKIRLTFSKQSFFFIQKWQTLLRLPQALQLDELRIPLPQGHQFLMAAALNNLALVKHIDDVCVLDGAQSVGDANGGSAGAGVVEGGLDDLFGFAVEGGGGFVEETIKTNHMLVYDPIRQNGEEVVMGTYRILGFRINALAIAIRCFCPPLNSTPREPHIVAKPSGKLMIKS